MTLKEQIRSNRWRTLWLLLLFAALAGVIGAIGAFLYDPSILLLVAIVAFVYAIFSWFAAGSDTLSAVVVGTTCHCAGLTAGSWFRFPTTRDL